MYLLENYYLSLMISSKGAELQSLVLKKHGRQYLWQGDASLWGRRSPILFPIVGKLQEGKYHHYGKDYFLTQHGFARDLPFQMVDHQENEITFQLQDSELTRESFPFSFTLQVSYFLIENRLKVVWQVENTDSQVMFYSIGAHPAFNIPLTPDSQAENTLVKIIGQEINQLGFQAGFLDPTPRPPQLDFSLSEVDFTAVDTLIYHTPQGGEVSISDLQQQHSVKITFDYHFPYLGIWTPQNGAPFVCLEPWAGVLDTFNHNGELMHKLGINRLAPQARQTFSYVIELN